MHHTTDRCKAKAGSAALDTGYMCKPLYTCSSYRSSVRAATSACSWASWSVKCCCSCFARWAADSACCSRHVVAALSSATCTSHPYLHQALKESWQAYEHSSFKAAHPERPTQYHIGFSCLQDQARLHLVQRRFSSSRDGPSWYAASHITCAELLIQAARHQRYRVK